MKKILVLLLSIVTFSASKADEGMWTLYNLPPAIFQQMQAEGFKLSYNDLYYGKHAVKNAVVNFSGFCSGVVVSADGLVFTNHHCGFEAIRSHSTVEHDYMLNGFYAKSFDEELPNENMFVSFMIEQKDITDDIMSQGFEEMGNMQKHAFLDSLENAMSREVKASDPTLSIEIKPFYEGNKYYATTYRVFNDVRLVFTVPKSMGKFGGDTDNWMWPRQTCDFAVFRIYADPKTNGPADYSKANVPYRPEHWAPISMEGYKDGDFAMTIGYPGTTERYLSSFGIRQRRDAENEPRAQVRGVKQAVMLKHMRASEAVRIKYDSKYASSANYWKNSIGMNKCIDSIQLIEQKREFEHRIEKWQKENSHKLRHTVDFERLESLYKKQYNAYRTLMYWSETFSRTCEFTTRAMVAVTLSKRGLVEGNEKKNYIEFKDNSDTWDEALDKEVLTVLLKNYAEQVDARYLPAFYKDIRTKFGGNYQKYVDFLYKKSALMKKGKKINHKSSSFLKDPGIKFGKDLFEVYRSLAEIIAPLSEEIADQERYLCDAKVRMEEDLPHYSDANFTMRLSYGQVGGFMLGGKMSDYYTTSESILEKMKQADKNFEYYAEPIMHELFSATDYGKYTDPTTGKMHLCFITNNDITGGNSGSPMFDGQGRLIGLAFDGNWDSLASDILFDKVLARCIGADIRYIIFMMDKWGHADRLLREMGVQ
ncbi:MAG: S46 family peptidase [Prevotella sp.]|nr:S46 family peptidase [Prevotella sp.]